MNPSITRLRVIAACAARSLARDIKLQCLDFAARSEANAHSCGQSRLTCSTVVCLLSPTEDMPPDQVCAAVGHVWTAPGWQEFSSRKQQWSEQPCVRRASAVHVTAGHNALRGSGPGQLHAFDNAVARVGCPDRRIDRLCITCCSPFPNVTSRRMPDAISFTPRVRRVACSARPWSSLPMPFGLSCWRARRP
jgi:hypothetical protein